MGRKGTREAHLAPREPAAAPREEAEHTEEPLPARQRDPRERHEALVAGPGEIDEMRLVTQ
jgi:hypothetical protein